MWCAFPAYLTKYLFPHDQSVVHTPSLHFLLRAMFGFQNIIHNGMKSLYPLIILIFLLSTAYCDGSPSVNDGANFVTEIDIITEIDVQEKYDSETTDSPLFESTSGRKVFQTNDFVSETINTAFASSLIKNDKIETANEASTFSSIIAKKDNTAITYPMTQTVINAEDRIIAMYTSNSEQTKNLEHGHSSMTPPTTKFLPTTCDTDQVEVKNSPEFVKAFTNATNCSILVTAQTDTSSIMIKLLHSGLRGTKTYFYVEKLGNLPQDCPDRYVLVSVDFAPCTTMILGGQFRFFFQNTMINLEMRIVDVPVSSSIEKHINALEEVQCNSTIYETEIDKTIKPFEYRYHVESGRFDWYWKTVKLIVNVTHYLARCACYCLDNCMCTLGYREWLSKCIDSKNGSTTHAEFIVYKQTMSGLSFANTGMNEIQQHALLGLGMLEVLILEHNSLTTLPTTICQNLPQLKVLLLGYNVLSNLTSNIFKGQCGHELIGIHINNNKLTYLERDLFNSTSNLSHLDLSQNRLAHIPKDTFRTLTELSTLTLIGNHLSDLDMLEVDGLRYLYSLYLRENNISILRVGVFQSLQLLRNLDLSDNNISVLAVGVFNGLRSLNFLDLKDNYISVLPLRLFALVGYVLLSLDLSGNHISELPASVFDSLKVLVTLDLSSNYISVLSNGVFDFVGRFGFRTIDLHANKINTLHANVFKSPQVAVHT